MGCCISKPQPAGYGSPDSKKKSSSKSNGTTSTATSGNNDGSYSPRSEISRGYGSYSPRSNNSPGVFGGGGYSPRSYGCYSGCGGCDFGGYGGGCFGANSLVEKQDSDTTSTFIEISKIQPGDYVRIADGSFARVKNTVKIARSAGKMLVYFHDGLTITPKHPIFVDDSWKLPRDLVDNENVFAFPTSSDHFVYNLFLDKVEEFEKSSTGSISVAKNKNHTIIVDNVPCATWGHGLEDDEVIRHEYFGNYDFVDKALSQFEGYDEGVVSIGFGGLLKGGGALMNGFQNGETRAYDLLT